MNYHNITLIVLILLTMALVAGIYMTRTQSIFADSRILKQDTKQNANCDTVGADSSISDSCNQRATNSVNNGILRPAVIRAQETTGTPSTGAQETTGTPSTGANIGTL